MKGISEMKNERGKGNKAHIGYDKLIIKGKVYTANAIDNQGKSN